MNYAKWFLHGKFLADTNKWFASNLTLVDSLIPREVMIAF